MKKKIIRIFIVILVILVFFSVVAFFLSRGSGKGALQVTANPKSKVYINGTFIGDTPLCKCEGNDMVAVGEYTIKVDPENAQLPAFEEKITVAKGILTVVDRTFGKGVTSEGSVITLTPLEDPKAVQLLVISFPQGSQVLVDSSPSGVTPLLMKDITESDHEVVIKKEGYREKSVRIKTIAGYKLTIVAYLGVSLGISPTPAPTIAVTPTATPEGRLTPIVSKTITIRQTPTGFLRVRKSSSSASLEVGRVTPGSTFTVLSEDEEWYQITLESGETGWVSKQYATENN